MWLSDDIKNSLFQISLGTIANVDEAVEWLSYTYLYIRMMANPMVYGISYGAKEVFTLSCLLHVKLNDFDFFDLLQSRNIVFL